MNCDKIPLKKILFSKTEFKCPFVPPNTKKPHFVLKNKTKPNSTSRNPCLYISNPAHLSLKRTFRFVIING